MDCLSQLVASLIKERDMYIEYTNRYEVIDHTLGYFAPIPAEIIIEILAMCQIRNYIDVCKHFNKIAYIDRMLINEPNAQKYIKLFRPLLYSPMTDEQLLKNTRASSELLVNAVSKDGFIININSYGLVYDVNSGKHFSDTHSDYIDYFIKRKVDMNYVLTQKDYMPIGEIIHKNDKKSKIYRHKKEGFSKVMIIEYITSGFLRAEIMRALNNGKYLHELRPMNKIDNTFYLKLYPLVWEYMDQLSAEKI